MNSELQNQNVEKNNKKKKKSLFSYFNPLYVKEENEDLLEFTKNFASLIKDNMSIVASLETLSTKINDKKLKKIIVNSIEQVRAGLPLHVCFRKHKDIFDDTYCELIKIGEESGRLDKVLDSLSIFIAQNNEIKEEINNTSFYISKVISFSFFEIMFLMAGFVPPFAKLYIKLKKPYITDLVINAGLWFQSTLIYILAIVFISFALFHVIKLTKFGKFIIDYFKTKVPVFGKIVNQYSFICFARNFIVAFNSGINIIPSLQLSSNIIPNLFLKYRLNKVAKHIEEGNNITEAFSKTRILSKKTMNMISNGEESGHIDGMFKEIADDYEKESLAKLNQITSMVKPTHFVIMSLICGTVVLAMFLPLFEIIKTTYIK